MIAAQAKPSLYMPSFLSSIFESSRENNQLSQSTSVLNSLDTSISTNNQSTNLELFPLIKNCSRDIFAKNFFTQKSSIQQLTETDFNNVNKSRDNLTLMTSISVLNSKTDKNWTEENMFKSNTKVSSENIKKTNKITSFDVKSILR